MSSFGLPLIALFLSTPSARRATIEEQLLREVEGISIHALCEEGDNTRPAEIMPWAYFYPRPPRGGRPRALSDLFR